MNRPFTDNELEALEVLAGKRSKGKDRAAVLKKDIAEFARVSSKAEVCSGATPTKAEYDQLVYDFKRLVVVLNNIGKQL